MHRIRLLVMCDHMVARRVLSSIFTANNNFKILGEIGCGPDSIIEAQNYQPDAILYRDEAGEKAVAKIKQLKEACPCTKLFVASDRFDFWRLIIEAGADGCLMKTMLPRDQIKVVELTCQSGVLCLPSFLGNKDQIIEYLHNKMHCNRSLPINDDGSNDAAIVQLTTRELDIYNLLLQNYSNKEIGKKLFISQPTVKSHVSSVLHKMGLHNRTELLANKIKNKGIVEPVLNTLNNDELIPQSNVSMRVIS